MFVKFTRLDNSPIWINASFVVTVEPRRKDGGSTVVPIGDGLDYDVRETPEQVLAILAGAPVSEVVPIPVSDCLTKSSADVQPEAVDDERKSEVPVAETPVAEAAPDEVKKPAKKRKTTKKATKPEDDEAAKAEAAAVVVATAATAEKPVKKRTTRKRKLAMPLSEDQLIRLRKMVPGSIKRLNNTLISQFKVAESDCESIVAALESNGVFEIDGVRLDWKV